MAGNDRKGRTATQGEGDGDDRSILTRERLEGYRDRLVNTAILGLPMAAIDWGIEKVSEPLMGAPWHILWFVAPLAVAAWVLWRRVLRRGTLRVRGSMLLFLVCYLSIFNLAAGSDLLVWERETVAFEQEDLARNWLAPAGWGDWRYHLASRPPADSLLTIVTMEEPTGQSLAAMRVQLARLIQVAAESGGRGIGLDFYFSEESTPADGLLCNTVEAAGIDVIAGHRMIRGETGRLFAESYAETLQPCFPGERRGHLLAYEDPDHTVRQIGRRVQGEEAFSLRVASSLAGGPDELPTTRSNVIRFVEPRARFVTVPFEEFADLPPDELRGLLDGYFIVVGERSKAERFRTPYGERLGVEVHAAAIASLLTDTTIERPPWWTSLLLILVSCYLIVVLAVDGMPTRRLAVVAAAISVFVFAAAAAAMALWNVWLDVIYAVAAVWLLLGLLPPLRERLDAAES